MDCAQLATYVCNVWSDNPCTKTSWVKPSNRLTNKWDCDYHLYHRDSLSSARIFGVIIRIHSTDHFGHQYGWSRKCDDWSDVCLCCLRFDSAHHLEDRPSVVYENLASGCRRSSNHGHWTCSCTGCCRYGNEHRHGRRWHARHLQHAALLSGSRDTLNSHHRAVSIQRFAFLDARNQRNHRWIYLFGCSRNCGFHSCERSSVLTNS